MEFVNYRDKSNSAQKKETSKFQKFNGQIFGYELIKNITFSCKITEDLFFKFIEFLNNIMCY